MADLRAWLADELALLQARARQRPGEPVPMQLPPDKPLFDVPTGLRRILDRDLVAAGLAQRVKDPATGAVRVHKCDERGRSIDVHALRHTFGTHLSKGGVHLRTAQAAMRHSTPTLTANVYADLKLLDVAGALEVLPKLPLEEVPQPRKQAATGTGGKGRGLTGAEDSRSPGPTLVPAARKSCLPQAPAGTSDADGPEATGQQDAIEPFANREDSAPLAAAGSGCLTRGDSPGIETLCRQFLAAAADTGS